MFSSESKLKGVSYLGNLKKRVRDTRDKRLERAPRICFVHVPKCAGTSVTEAIARQYGFVDKILYRNFVVSGGTSELVAQTLGVSRRDIREKVVAYMLAKEEHKFVTGHFPCPPEFVETFRDRWSFVTVLRDPVERWISGYLYDRYQTTSHAQTQLTAEEFLISEKGRFNGMSYLAYFSDMPTPSISSPGAYRSYVDEAVSNVNKFELVGLTNDLDKFAADFRRVSGRSLKIKHANKTRERVAKEEIYHNEKLLQEIQEICRPDIEFYTRVMEKQSWTKA